MRNRYKIEGDKLIILLDRKNGEVIETVTDAKFLDKLMSFDVKWSAKYAKNTKTFYVQVTEYFLPRINGRKQSRTRYLHIFLMDAPEGKFVDHINHDTLDNRECNLQVVEAHVNSRNRSGPNSNNPLGVRNVFWSSKENKYVVSLWLDGKHTRFGTYKDLDLAEHVAEFVRKKYYGA